MKTASVARKRVPRKPLVFDPKMSTIGLRDLFLEIMSSKEGLTKSVFFNYWKLYPSILRDSVSILHLFSNPKLRIVDQDNEEYGTSSLVKEKDNNGHSLSWLDIDTLEKAKWKKIYKKPDNLSVTSAIQLARSFNKTRAILLTSEEKMQYKDTLVGDPKEQLTFPNFCAHLNTLNACT